MYPNGLTNLSPAYLQYRGSDTGQSPQCRAVQHLLERRKEKRRKPNSLAPICASMRVANVGPHLKIRAEKKRASRLRVSLYASPHFGARAAKNMVVAPQAAHGPFSSIRIYENVREIQYSVQNPTRSVRLCKKILSENRDVIVRL